MTTSDDASEVHPDSIETVKLYVPGTRFEIIVVVPVPVIAPGLIVHVPAYRQTIQYDTSCCRST